MSIQAIPGQTRHVIWHWGRLWWYRLAASLQHHTHALAAENPPSTGAKGQSETEAEFEAFFQCYAPQVAGYCWRMAGDTHLANDLCQEVFLRAWQHFAVIRAYEHPLMWLLRVATNLALTARRRQQAPVGAATPLLDIIPSAGDFTVTQAEREQVRQVLQSLPPKARAMLVLREVNGLSTEEAAEVLGISLVAARRMLSRARAEFRERYLRKEEHP